MSNIIKYIMEDEGVIKGFFAINFKKGLPHLQHFYMDEPYRNINNLRKLAKVFTNIIKKLGYKTVYLHAKSQRQMKLITYFFKQKPYGLDEKQAWYLVDINKGRLL